MPTSPKRFTRTPARLHADDPLGVELDHALYELDATMFDLCMSLFPWPPFRRNTAAIKIGPQAGAFDVMDRACLDFDRLYRFTAEGAFFLIRAKSHLPFRRRYSR